MRKKGYSVNTHKKGEESHSRKRVKKSKNMSKSEENHNKLFYEIDEGFCIIEVLFDEEEKPIDYRFLEINPAFEKLTGLLDVRGKTMKELAPLHEDYWFELYGNVALTGKPIRFQQRAEQLHRWYNVYAFRTGKKESRHVAILFNDISEIKRNEEKARIQATEIEAILSCIAEGVMVLNKEGKIIRSNATANEIFNFSEDVLKLPIEDRYKDDYGIWAEDGHRLTIDELPAMRAAVYAEITKSINLKVQGRGEPRWINLSAAPLMIAGKHTGAVVSMSNITSQKRSEEELKEAYNNIEERLKEKEVLLREIYHRTKNSMQLVSSILNMKSRMITDPVAQTIFKEIQNRIRSIALVHERIYSGNNLSMVNLKEYIIDLGNLLIGSNSNGNKIIFKHDLEEVNLLIDSAIPCGLILTEVLLNSIRYAFPGDRSGYIEIKLRRLEDQMIELIIADNGTGIRDLKQNDEMSMGLQLIRNIAEAQLNATIDLKADDGVKWTIRFKDDLYYARV